MKRLVVFCDGTWQDLNAKFPTNVVKLMQAVKQYGDDGAAQLVYYDAGVGSSGGLDRLSGGAFGYRLSLNIQEAYQFICLNYELGDQIIVIGFSRGAFTVRSLAGLIAKSGLLRRPYVRLTPQAYELYRGGSDYDSADDDFKSKSMSPDEIEISFLGCWDTVGSLGIPNKVSWIPFDEWVNEKYQFHDRKINPVVKHARHAMAIDEHRSEFNVTRMELPDDSAQIDLKEVWFAGDHSAVGGGDEEKEPLANIALNWMINEINSLNFGLALDLGMIDNGTKVDSLVPCKEITSIIYGKNKRKIEDSDKINSSVRKRWLSCPWYRPVNLPPAVINQYKQELGQCQLKQLAVNEEATFAVIADCKNNHSGLLFQQGEQYRITTRADDTWTDSSIVCGPEGWKTDEQNFNFIKKCLISAGESHRVMPDADWFELIGKIQVDDGEPIVFRIGNGEHCNHLFNAQATGEFCAFANDLPHFYFNNKGMLWVKVKRIS